MPSPGPRSRSGHHGGVIHLLGQNEARNKSPEHDSKGDPEGDLELSERPDEPQLETVGNEHGGDHPRESVLISTPAIRPRRTSCP
jgi:hypothetical protein